MLKNITNNSVKFSMDHIIALVDPSWSVDHWLGTTTGTASGRCFLILSVRCAVEWLTVSLPSHWLVLPLGMRLQAYNVIFNRISKPRSAVTSS